MRQCRLDRAPIESEITDEAESTRNMKTAVNARLALNDANAERGESELRGFDARALRDGPRFLRGVHLQNALSMKDSVPRLCLKDHGCMQRCGFVDVVGTDPCSENSRRMPDAKGLEVRHTTPATTTASLLLRLGSKAGKRLGYVGRGLPSKMFSTKPNSLLKCDSGCVAMDSVSPSGKRSRGDAEFRPVVERCHCELCATRELEEYASARSARSRESATGEPTSDTRTPSTSASSHGTANLSVTPSTIQTRLRKQRSHALQHIRTLARVCVFTTFCTNGTIKERFVKVRKTDAIAALSQSSDFASRVHHTFR